MATDASGQIDTNTEWDLAGSPCTLVGDLQISNGVTLTINAGVIVNNPDGYSTVVYGIIQAQADANNPANDFLDDNTYAISLHTNTATVDASNNYWGTTDPAVIATRINDSNDNPSILGTVIFEPFATTPFNPE